MFCQAEKRKNLRRVVPRRYFVLCTGCDHGKLAIKKNTLRQTAPLAGVFLHCQGLGKSCKLTWSR